MRGIARIGLAALASVALPGMSVHAAPIDPGIEASIATQGVSKGLRQTEGPQVLVKTQLGIGAFYVGAQIKNVDASAEAEAAVFAGAKTKLAGFDLEGGIAFKALIERDAGASDTRALEVNGAIGRKIGPVGAKASLVYSPDDFGSTRSSAYFLGTLVMDVRGSAQASANIGRRERSGGADYTAFNIGVTQTLAKFLSADLRYHDTGQGSLGEIYRDRVVASLKLKF